MENKLKIALIESYARKCYDNANCTYGHNDGNYYIHIKMVIDAVKEHGAIFKHSKDYYNTLGGAHCHDLIEDAKQTFNNVKAACGEEVAKITLLVTDIHGENRLMRHLLTMHKTVEDYRAIILKLCDIYANAYYSKKYGSSMYKKYVEEYAYRKPIFMKALSWYKEQINEDELKKLWKKLDEVHKFK